MTTDAGTKATEGTKEGTTPSGTTTPSTPEGNSQSLAALQEQITKLQSENASLATQYKEIALRSLPVGEREKAEALLSEIEKKQDLDDRETQLEEQARDIMARELALENRDYGVTVELLTKAESPAEMEAIAARTKADFLEKKLNGDGGGAEGNKEGNKEGANPGTVPSDKGASGSGTGGGSDHPIVGKGRDAVAAHIGELARARRGG